MPIVPYTDVRANDVQIHRFQDTHNGANADQSGSWNVLNAEKCAHITVSEKDLTSHTHIVLVHEDKFPSSRIGIKIEPDFPRILPSTNFYRELRDSTGTVRPEVKAQHPFMCWERLQF